MASRAYEKHLKEQQQQTSSLEGRGTNGAQASATAVLVGPDGTGVGNGTLDENAPAAEQWATAIGLHLIPLELVCESPANARKHFDADELSSLADSMRLDGVNTEAAIVRRLPDASLLPGAPLFELVSGHRRFRALNRIDAKFIKAEIQDVPSLGEAHRKSLLANLHRADLNAIEKGAAFEDLMRVGGYGSVRELAIALGLEAHERTLIDLIGLSALTDAVKAAVIEGRITQSHAVLIAREDAEDQARCLEACFATAVSGGVVSSDEPQLVSEKTLRAWIKEHLREEKKPEAQIPFDQSGKDAAAQGAESTNKDGGADDDDLTPAQRKEVMPSAAEAQQQLDNDAKPRERKMEARAEDPTDPVTVSRTADQKLNEDWRRRVLKTYLKSKFFFNPHEQLSLLRRWVREEFEIFERDYKEESDEVRKLIPIPAHGGWWVVADTSELVRTLFAMKFAGAIFSHQPGIPVDLLAASRNAGVKTDALYEEARAAEAGLSLPKKKDSPPQSHGLQPRRKDAKKSKQSKSKKTPVRSPRLRVSAVKKSVRKKK